MRVEVGAAQYLHAAATANRMHVLELEKDAVSVAVSFMHVLRQDEYHAVRHAVD
jgi:hypothetical protein